MFESLPNGHIRVSQDLYVDLWPLGQSVVVPQGFVSDGFSIPSLLWPLVGHPLGQPHMIPAIVHDWYCKKATSAAERAYGDAVFFLLLERYADFSKTKRRLFYFGVRLNSIFFWGRKK